MPTIYHICAYFGQRVHGSPGTALALRIAEHAVGALVRAAVRAVLAGKGSVHANGFDHAHAAVRPLVTLDQPHAVGADFLFRNIISVTSGTAGAVVRRILLRFAGTQILSAFIDDGAVPVGLTHHLLTERDEVLIGKRRIDCSGNSDLPALSGARFHPQSAESGHIPYHSAHRSER